MNSNTTLDKDMVFGHLPKIYPSVKDDWMYISDFGRI